MPSLTLGIVRFFGPKRNDAGHLWGFLEAFNPDGNTRDIYVSERDVEGRIQEGQVVAFDEQTNRRSQKLQARHVRPLGSAKDDWHLVFVTITALREHGKDIPPALSSFLGGIDAQHLPIDMTRFLPPSVIASRAAADESQFIGFLRQTKRREIPSTWLRHWVPPTNSLSAPLALEALQIVSELETEQGSQVILRIWKSLGDGEQRSIIAADANFVAHWITPRLDDSTIMSSHLLIDLLPPHELARLVREALHNKSTFDLLARTLGDEHLRHLAWTELKDQGEERPLVAFEVAKDLSQHAHLMEPGLRNELEMWGSSTDHSLADLFRRHLEDLAASHPKPSPGTDRQQLRERTARILLSLPVDRAVHLARTGNLQGEFIHVLTCLDKAGSPLDPDACLSSPDLLGHAIGHVVAQSVVGGAISSDSRQHVRQILRTALTPHNVAAPTDVESLYYDVLNEWLLSLFVSGTFAMHAGDLRQILPRCSENVVSFCEGKPAGEGFDSPYCPRTNTGCSAALVAPAQKAESSDWNIIDLLGSAGASTRHNLHGRTLANTIAGWANRYHEMSERMTCAGCGGELRAHFEFSKKFEARYATTRGTCARSCGAPDVYLNHCFNCHEIIDNRESPYFVSNDGRGSIIIDTGGNPDRTTGKGLYLCIHCANGGLPWCPKCGNPRNEAIGFGENRRCLRCDHTVSAHPRGSRGRLRTRVLETSDAGLPRTPTNRLHIHPTWDGTRRKQALEIMVGSRHDGF